MGTDEEKEGPEVERRQGANPSKMRSKKIAADQVKALTETLGLTHKEIFNRRGWLRDKGLAVLMEAGDRLVEITETHAVLETAGGVRQTFWNLRKELPFLKKAEVEEKT